jgi:methionine-rich copper-binding protein CopC
MKMRYLRYVLAALAVGAWAAGPLTGAAGARLLAPTYQSSEPERDAMMDEPPSEVTVTFSEPLDPSSVMTVLDECGNDVDDGPATITLNEMRVGIAKTPSGMYKVVYRAVGVGGITGTTGGNFEFMVHNGRPCKGGKKDRHHHDDEKKHDDHRDDHDEHPDPDHTDHPDGGPDHTDHDMGSGDHDASGHDMASSHGSDNGHADHHAAGRPREKEERPLADVNQSLAAGPEVGPLRADGQAMLIGLGLALAVGVLGGWLLRISGNLIEAR